MRRIPFNSGWTYKCLKDSHEYNAPRVPIDLPHDAVIAGMRDPDQPNGTKKAFFPNGAWEYVKSFDAPVEWQDKCIYLEFQGIQNHGTVYINGNYVGQCAYGYSELLLPIHSFLNFGGRNAVQVLCKTEDDSRWYTGGGIYRDVELLIGDAQHIVPNGVKIKTVSASAERASLEIEISLAEPEETKVEFLAYKNGVAVAQASGNIIGKGTLCTEIKHPELWSDESPELYDYLVRTSNDETWGSFGIRTLSVSTKTGLLINGKQVKLRGACIHHDNGILGVATYRDAELRRVKLLKEAGFNAIRSAHHPASRYLLDACDEIGMYVMDESFDIWQLPKSPSDYALDFDHNWKRDIESMVNKDYDHPSVIIYSIGNEISDLATPVGVKLAGEISDYVKSLDSTRFTTVAVNGILLLMRKMEVYSQLTGEASGQSQDVNAEMSSLDDVMLRINNAPTMDAAISGGCDAVDIAGYNYMHNRYEPDMDKYPDRVIVGSETYAKYIAQMWDHISKHNNVIGDFTWTGWDYLGETGIGNTSYEPRDYHGGFYGEYPCITANCGDIDITGFRTPQSFYREIAYGIRKAPYIAVHDPKMAGRTEYLSTWGWGEVFSSWSFDGFENVPLSVDVYGRGKIELFLNGEKIGVGYCKDDLKCSFTVPYSHGTLTAKGDEGSYSLTSASDDVQINISPEKAEYHVGELIYINISLTDSNGTVHFGPDREIKLDVTGARLLGFGSGAPITEESYTDNLHTTYHGRALAVVRAERDGSINITASAAEIENKTVELEVLA